MTTANSASAPNRTFSRRVFLGQTSVWAAETPDEKAPVDFLKPRDRRRLSALGRAALCVLEPFFETLNPMRDAVVFASRSGDLPLTEKLLASINDPDGLSPTLFSTSVHNAISGLFSILSGFQGHVTSIGAGSATFSAALTEAAALLTEFERVVVCVYESATPEGFATADGVGKTFAYAFEVRRAAEAAPVLTLEHVEADSAASAEEPARQSAPLAALDFLEGRTNVFEETADGVVRRWIRRNVR